MNGSTLIRLLDRFGPWVVIAGFLIYWVTNGLSAKVDAINSSVTSHVSESNFYMRQICLNTAKDDAQRASCIPPPPPR